VQKLKMFTMLIIKLLMKIINNGIIYLSQNQSGFGLNKFGYEI
jgi:hypothetical protein